MTELNHWQNFVIDRPIFANNVHPILVFQAIFVIQMELAK